MGGQGTDSLAYLVLWSILALMGVAVAAVAGAGVVLLNGVVEFNQATSASVNVTEPAGDD
ncbi:MAG: hypothetical protein ABI720_09520 [Actinomycetes bacterium]